MSLLEEVKAAVETLGNNPGYSIAEVVDGMSQTLEETEVVEDKDTGGYSRWSNINRAVLRRGDEYVAVEYNEPATENQDWSDWSADEVEVYAVVPRVVTTEEYVKA